MSMQGWTLAGHGLATQKLLPVVISVLTMHHAGCAGPVPDSGTEDIFIQDQGDSERGNARRHPADATEKLWTIDMGGCTGHLIAPDLMMTAAHCSPRSGSRYKSGYSIVSNAGSDVEVTEVIERDRNLDYAILRIQWTSGGFPRSQRFPPLVATSAADIRTGSATSEGDAIFTVGFPGDKRSTWGATYAEGHAKTVADRRLYYNIGIINGNSGGGVWKKSDKMLVSLTNGGAHALGQPGWNTADISSSQNWNFGAAMWEVYAVSQVLKDVFPGGRNRFAATTSPLAQDVYVLLGEADRTAADSFNLYIAVPDAAQAVVFCRTPSPEECDRNQDSASNSVFTTRIGSQSVFKASGFTALRPGLVLSFVALGADGSKIAGRTLRFDLN